MNLGDILLRTLPSLTMIVGALLLLRYWAQRGRQGSDAGVEVLTRTGITKGAVVAVVVVGGRRLLVGASEHGVNLLTELDDQPIAIDAIADVSQGATMDPVAPAASPRPATSLSAASWTHTDRPRMAPIDRLRHLTVRRAVPSHPRRSNGARRRT